MDDDDDDDDDGGRFDVEFPGFDSKLRSAVLETRRYREGLRVVD